MGLFGRGKRDFINIYGMTKFHTCPSILKEFLNHDSDICRMINFDLEYTENIVGKGENAGYQHFLLF